MLHQPTCFMVNTIKYATYKQHEIPNLAGNIFEIEQFKNYIPEDCEFCWFRPQWVLVSWSMPLISSVLSQGSGGSSSPLKAGEMLELGQQRGLNWERVQLLDIANHGSQSPKIRLPEGTAGAEPWQPQFTSNRVSPQNCTPPIPGHPLQSNPPTRLPNRRTGSF